MKITFVVDLTNRYSLFKYLAHFLNSKGYSVCFAFIDCRKVSEEHLIESKEYSLEELALSSPNENENLFWAMNNFDSQLNSDVYIIPFEFNKLSFLTFFAQKRQACVIHVQHALWGKGKFFKTFVEKPPEEASKYTKVKKAIRKNLSHVKRFFLGQNQLEENPNSEEFSKYLMSLEGLSDDELYYQTKSDYFLAPNTHYKNQMMEERPSFDSESIIISGMLKPFGEPLYSKKELASKLKLNHDKNWVTYLFTSFENYAYRYTLNQPTLDAFDEFLGYFSNDEDVEIIVVIHPSSMNVIDELKTKIGKKGKVCILSDEHMDVYKYSGLVCGVRSTALLEACYSLTPVVRQLYPLKGHYDHVQYDTNGIYMAHSKDEMMEFFDEILGKNNHPKKSNQCKIREEFFVPFQTSEIESLMKRIENRKSS